MNDLCIDSSGLTLLSKKQLVITCKKCKTEALQFVSSNNKSIVIDHAERVKALQDVKEEKETFYMYVSFLLLHNVK